MSGGTDRPLRLGALGTSSIARRRALPSAVAAPEVELVAVAGRSAQKTAVFAEQFGCAAEADPASLLERPDVEAVYISTPTALHHTWAARALRAGKHVLVEKPVGVNAHEARELADLARERGLVLRENFMFLHHPQHDFAADLVRRGRLGRLSAMHAAFCIPPLPADDIRYVPDMGAGRCWTWGCIRCAPPNCCWARGSRWPGRCCVPGRTGWTCRVRRCWCRRPVSSRT